MIESGSHAPGVRSADFGLPAGTALRIERAADALRPVLSSYAVLDSDATLWSGASNWLLPRWAMIWIGLAPDPLDVTVGRRHYPRLGTAMLFGVTSRAMPASTYGGVSVVIDIGPLAWARLFAPSAETLRDRITPLAELVPPGWSEDLVERVARSNRGTEIKAVLDRFFLERLPPPHLHETTLARILALLLDERTHDLANAAAQIGIDGRLLARLAKRYFGFPPKMLSMRVRFLRALTAMLIAPRGSDVAATPAGYYDRSHFIRDANRFLGIAPRRFLALDQPYARAALRARLLVMGAATSSLDAAVEPVVSDLGS